MKIDGHDRELLERQLQHVRPANETSTLAGAIIVVFLVGVTFGGLLFAASDQPPVASISAGEPQPLIAQLYNAAPPFSRE
ncbi:MAG TPA: hypothetical protein VH206_07430 [Xanthobacteraceae bacterium]|jgi:hypothetical protein|nr:hypothetical protein [Xanthobacteraceae bacterium]